MKILIVGPSWVGDAVMAQSLYKIIKSKNDHQIDVLSPEWSVGILQRMEEVSEVIISPFKHGELNLQERRSLGKRLRERDYDKSIILTNSFKSSLVPYFANIPTRVGWLGEFRYGFINDIRKFNKHESMLMIERFALLESNSFEAEKIPRPSLSVDGDNVETLLFVHGIDEARPTIALCPGAEFGPAKRWPSYYYSEITDDYLSKGWNVIILGSSKDSKVALDIKNHLSIASHKNLFDLTGKTTLPDAVDILSMTDIVLTNDSGLMHIAAAVEAPLVALYGPSSPEFTPPLGKKSKVIRKESGYEKVRIGNTKEGYHPSLVSIKPKEVLAELSSLIGEGK